MKMRGDHLHLNESHRKIFFVRRISEIDKDLVGFDKTFINLLLSPVDLQLHSITSFLPLAFPRLLEEFTKPLHHVPRGSGAPLAFVPGEVVVAGDVGPVPAVVDLGLLGVGAHLPGVEPLAVASLRPHVAPPVVRLAPGVDVAVPLSG